MNLGLKDRVALVAGGSQGLGRAIALALAQEGAKVALGARGLSRTRRAAKEIALMTSCPTMASSVDVAEASSCRAWVEAVWRRWKRIDILVHNAGGPAEGEVDEIADEEWRRSFERNLLSGARLARLVAPSMRKRHWGRVIFIASTSAKQPIPGLAVSNTLRAGILGLSKTLSLELGPHNITVNVVCPGYTTTERLSELARAMARKNGVSQDEMLERWAKSVPLRALAEPAQIAAPVAFLASERASYVTGAVLQVDGGRVSSPY